VSHGEDSTPKSDLRILFLGVIPDQDGPFLIRSIPYHQEMKIFRGGHRGPRKKILEEKKYSNWFDLACIGLMQGIQPIAQHPLWYFSFREQF
jgi:hypothetical protein